MKTKKWKITAKRVEYWTYEYTVEADTADEALVLHNQGKSAPVYSNCDNGEDLDETIAEVG